MLGDAILAAAVGFSLATATTPMGVSGAVFFLFAIPGALVRFRREGRLTGGARLQPRLPEALLRRGLGLLALTLGAHYAVQALG